MRLFIILFGSLLFSYGQEKVLFFQTDWGNQLSWDACSKKTRASAMMETLKERLNLNK